MRRSCRPARSCRRGHHLRSSCCRPSSALPSRAPRSRDRRTRRRSPRSRRSRGGRSSRGSGPSASHRSASSPEYVMRICLPFFCTRHCVASTCSTSDVPMPNASAPNAPCVDVWLSPHTIVMPGLRHTELGSDHVDDPASIGPDGVHRDAELGAVPLERLHLFAGQLVGDLSGHRDRIGRHVVVGGREGLVRTAHSRGRRDGVRRTPAATSPRGRGAGRCTADRRAPRALPRSCRTAS